MEFYVCKSDSIFYGSIFFFGILSILLSLVIIILAFYIAVRKPDQEKLSSYECGFEPFEDARNKFDVRFYIIAILFIVFDIEVIFLYPWVMSLSSIGNSGFWSMIIFLILLIIGFIYEVIKGALEW